MAKRSKTRRDQEQGLAEPDDAPETAVPAGAPGSGWRTASILIALVGLVLSLVSAYVTFRLAAGGGEYQSFCSINPTVNCDEVLASPFSKPFGIPVVIPAIFSYALLLVLLLIGRPGVGRPLAYAWLLSLGMLLFSLYMAFIAYVILKQICLLCTGLYVVALLLPFTIAKARQRPVGEVFQVLGWDLVELPRRPAILVPVLALAGVGFITLIALLASGDQERQAAEKKVSFMAWYQKQPQVQVPPNPAAPSHGAPQPQVLIEEFSDFQCPHCKRGAERMQELLANWGDKVRVVFRNYPLDNTCNTGLSRQIHEHACRAAAAAQCAYRQGKFWQYHDLLYANQDNLREENLMDYARQVGLDTNQLQGCMKDPEVMQVIKADIAVADKFKVQSTPTFFINGRMVAGTLPLDYYQALIEYEIGGPLGGAPPPP